MNEMEINAIIAGALVLGGLIVKLTPTKTDDAWWRRIKGLFGR